MPRTKHSTHGQQAHGDKYTGDYTTDSSHYFSSEMMNRFDLKPETMVAMNENGNYRNQNEYTNRSVHNRIDNAIMGDGYNARQVSGPSGDASYVPPQEQYERIHTQFGIASETYRQTGDRGCYNAMQHLRGIAGTELNGDMREFRMPNRR